MPQPPALKKIIRNRNLFTLAFGTIIGVGWITVMGQWLAQAGSIGAMLGFIIGGIFIIFIGLAYAELATMFPVSGGEIAYAYEIFGLKISFIVGWFLAFSYIAITAFEVISIGWVLTALVPALEGPTLYSVLGDDVHLGALALGLSSMLVITFLNYRGAKAATAVQDALIFLLLVISVIFIAVGLIYGTSENLSPAFVSDSHIFGPWASVAFIAATAAFWYGGFDTIPQAMGETAEDSNLALLPWVMTLAIAVAIAFYALVILAVAMSMPRDEILARDLPTAAALEAVLGSPALGKLVLFAGLLGLLSTFNAFFFAASRLLFAMGRAYMIPHHFAAVHKRFESPSVAIVFVGIVGAIGGFAGRTGIGIIVTCAGICFATTYLMVCYGVVKLRRTHPDFPRAYRTPFGLAIPAVAALFSLSALLISFFEPLTRQQQSGVPIEWLLLFIWFLVGGAFWALTNGQRSSVTEADRRRLIFDIDDRRRVHEPTSSNIVSQ